MCENLPITCSSAGKEMRVLAGVNWRLVLIEPAFGLRVVEPSSEAIESVASRETSQQPEGPSGTIPSPQL